MGLSSSFSKIICQNWTSHCFGKQSFAAAKELPAKMDAKEDFRRVRAL